MASVADAAAIDAAIASTDRLDGALLVMSYHDLHWKARDGSWPDTDPAIRHKTDQVLYRFRKRA